MQQRLLGARTAGWTERKVGVSVAKSRAAARHLCRIAKANAAITLKKKKLCRTVFVAAVLDVTFPKPKITEIRPLAKRQREEDQRAPHCQKVEDENSIPIGNPFDVNTMKKRR